MYDAKDKGFTDKQLRTTDGLRYAIKADGGTDYELVEKVIDIFRDKQIYQFNMVTSLEGIDDPIVAAAE
jgi:biopolymer transport protein ExbD